MTQYKQFILKLSMKWKPLNTIYEHSFDKQEWKAMLNFISGVKH